MTLLQWMEANEKSQVDVAETLGVDQSAVSLWLSGERKPNADSRIAIEQMTNKKVTIESWSTPAKRARKTKRAA
jgi:predicted transcriptional regulator